jgi:hypothetical protein
LDNQGSSILFMELEEAFKALDQKLEAFLNLKLVQIILTCGLTDRIQRASCMTDLASM